MSCKVAMNSFSVSLTSQSQVACAFDELKSSESYISKAASGTEQETWDIVVILSLVIFVQHMWGANGSPRYGSEARGWRNGRCQQAENLQKIFLQRCGVDDGVFLRRSRFHFRSLGSGMSQRGLISSSCPFSSSILRRWKHPQWPQLLLASLPSCLLRSSPKPRRL